MTTLQPGNDGKLNPAGFIMMQSSRSMFQLIIEFVKAWVSPFLVDCTLEILSLLKLLPMPTSWVPLTVHVNLIVVTVYVYAFIVIISIN